MSDESRSIHELLKENAALQAQLDELHDQAGEKAGGKGQPIQGMLKLLKSKNEQIQESIDKLEETNRELQRSYDQTVQYYKKTITALASAMEAKDPYFQFHSSQVQAMSRKIGMALSLDKKKIDLLTTAAMIHDFGNIGVRSAVLLKEGPLTPAEYQHVKTHALIASIILEPIGDLGEVIDAVKHHHENYDGSGYPEGLSGEDIPLFARIITIAESYDAITTIRPYRQPLEKTAAVQEIAAHIGTRYDPGIIGVFLQLYG